jgi:hypothetical protein
MNRTIVNYTSVIFLSGLGILNFWYMYPKVVERNENQRKMIMEKGFYAN